MDSGAREQLAKNVASAHKVATAWRAVRNLERPDPTVTMLKREWPGLFDALEELAREDLSRIR